MQPILKFCSLNCSQFAFLQSPRKNESTKGKTQRKIISETSPQKIKKILNDKLFLLNHMRVHTYSDQHAPNTHTDTHTPGVFSNSPKIFYSTIKCIYNQKQLNKCSKRNHISPTQQIASQRTHRTFIVIILEVTNTVTMENTTIILNIRN